MLLFMMMSMPISIAFFLFVGFLFFSISYSHNHDLRDVKALLDYDKQLNILLEQYKGSTSENVGFALLYHMREDRWKQGGDWEALYYTNEAIEALSKMNVTIFGSPQFLLPQSIYEDLDNISLDTSQLLDAIPTIRDMELYDGLHIHKIRLLTILGRYEQAQKLGDDEIHRHTLLFGKNDELLALRSRLRQQQLDQDQDLSNFSRLDETLQYIIEHRGLLHFIMGQAFLSSGDAMSSIRWFASATVVHPCLHQAYYQLSQALAASPWNNPLQQHSSSSSLPDIGNDESSRRKLLGQLEEVLQRIFLDPQTNQVQLSKEFHPYTFPPRAKSSFLSFATAAVLKILPFFFDKNATISNPRVVDNNVVCAFGDELQYFHVLLRHSHVSSEWDIDANNEETFVEEEKSDNLFQSPSTRHAKVTLSASHPAAFAQQRAFSSSSADQHPNGNEHQQREDSSEDQQQSQAVARDYVKVVQATLYWSLFTLADTLPDEEALAFFYLQQSRSLERFRVHHPLYALYSLADSQRQVAHIIRTFTKDYYPRPLYPSELPMSKSQQSLIQQSLQTQQGRQRQRQSPSVIFEHDLSHESAASSTKSSKQQKKKSSTETDHLYGDSNPRPVFIVGFFRSGSTLLETLLSKHDLVWGLGEHSAFATQMHRMQAEMLELATKFEQQQQQYLQQQQSQHQIQAQVRAIQEEMFRQILHKHAKIIDQLMTQRCAQYLHGHFSGVDQQHANTTNTTNTQQNPPRRCTRVIDKMLLNYRNIGLIHLLFPQAMILHTVRDPMDTLWSCMTHRFGDNAAYTLDYHLLVQEYRLYLQTMHHFRQSLPPRPPIWGYTTAPAAAAAAASATSGSENAKQQRERWRNVVECKSFTNDIANNRSVSFPIFCHQQQQQQYQHRDGISTSTSTATSTMSLLPMVDVRYDAVITRAASVIDELNALLQLPSRQQHSNTSATAEAAVAAGEVAEGVDTRTTTARDATAATTGADATVTGPIRTASYLQVRRPVNQQAQGKWRRYAPWLKYNLLPLWQETYTRSLTNTSVPFSAMNWQGQATVSEYNYVQALRSLAEEIDTLLPESG